MHVFVVHLREIDLKVPRRSSVNLPKLHNVESRCEREGKRGRDAPLNKRGVTRERPNSSLYVEQLARRRRRSAADLIKDIVAARENKRFFETFEMQAER